MPDVVVLTEFQWLKALQILAHHDKTLIGRSWISGFHQGTGEEHYDWKSTKLFMLVKHGDDSNLYVWDNEVGWCPWDDGRRWIPILFEKGDS